MQGTLQSLLKELDGIDIVLAKLETKSNVSVFEKLCANCDRVFNNFCELSIQEIVTNGYADMALEFLQKLKTQVVRLKNYKEVLTEYIKMTNGMPSVNNIQQTANNVVDMNKNKNLSLTNNDGIAA